MDLDSLDSLQSQLAVILTIAVIFLATALYVSYTYSGKKRKSGEKTSTPTVEERENYEEMLRSYQNEKGKGLSGSTKHYDWKQSETEMEVFVKLPEDRRINAKDLKVEIKQTSLRVALQGIDEPLLDGELYASVLWDESCWQLDTNDLGEQVVWITLFKSTPTVADEHWKGVLRKDIASSGASLSELGVPLHGVNPNDRSSMRDAIKKMKDSS